MTQNIIGETVIPFFVHGINHTYMTILLWFLMIVRSP